jgi:large subunit ribosomal protein L29
MAIKLKELADLNVGELEEKLAEAKEELFNLKFQHATGQLDNYKAIREARKDVARLKTVLRQRELAETEPREPEGQEEE